METSDHQHQTTVVKHLCLTEPRDESDGKDGRVYPLPAIIVEKYGHKLHSGRTRLILRGATICRHSNNNNRNDNDDERDDLHQHIELNDDEHGGWSVEIVYDDDGGGPTGDGEATDEDNGNDGEKYQQQQLQTGNQYGTSKVATKHGQRQRERRLSDLGIAPTVGNSTLLVVRVTALDGSVTPSGANIEQAIFSSFLTSVSTQYRACSNGQLQIQANPDFGALVELNWDREAADLNVASSSIENSLRAVLEESIGVPVTSFDHVIYCLPPIVTTFRSYTYPQTNQIWVYNNGCTYLSVLMHEIGHNLGFEHSNDKDNQEYEDRSCLMGVSYSDSFRPHMCFNGH